jgi:cytochrome d ubiquinol oxidase subunit II
MAELWFWIVAVMVAIYVVMDGFDFGAGALHLFVAKTNEERRQVLAAIGPLWDANEVWLLASGGALLLSFPHVLAAGFSGFYLAMFLVLWTLIIRGIAIEFRSHVHDSLWRAFWDVAFAGASLLLPVLFGAALGNVIRGVPLGADETFELALFTTFSPTNPVGLLDWYTTLVGVFALVTLAAEGSVFLAWKTDAAVQARSAAAARWLWSATGVLWLIVLFATVVVRPGMGDSIVRPIPLFAIVAAIGGYATVIAGVARRRYLMAFLGAAGFILTVLAGTAAAVFPVMLPSTISPAYDLTAQNSASSSMGLGTALTWWCVGFPLAIAYFAFLFRTHRGTVKAAGEGQGY